MPEPSLPLPEKIKITLLSFLLIFAIYTVIDLYVPIKKMFVGNPMSWQEMLAHVQLMKKLPIIVIFGVLMSMRTIKKRTQALDDSAKNV